MLLRASITGDVPGVSTCRVEAQEYGTKGCHNPTLASSLKKVEGGGTLERGRNREQREGDGGKEKKRDWKKDK